MFSSLPCMHISSGSTQVRRVQSSSLSRQHSAHHSELALQLKLLQEDSYACVVPCGNMSIVTPFLGESSKAHKRHCHFNMSVTMKGIAGPGSLLPRRSSSFKGRALKFDAPIEPLKTEGQNGHALKAPPAPRETHSPPQPLSARISPTSNGVHRPLLTADVPEVEMLHPRFCLPADSVAGNELVSSGMRSLLHRLTSSTRYCTASTTVHTT